MMATRLAIAALMSIALVAVPFAVQAKGHRTVQAKGHRTVQAKRQRTVDAKTQPSAVARKRGRSRPPMSTIQTGGSGPYRASRVSAPRTGSYGTSGTAVGTVTAPSVGSYNWPTVGVTNAVPTWKNTNPPVRR